MPSITNNVAVEKSRLRKLMLLERRTIFTRLEKRAEQYIALHLSTLSAYQNAKTIGLYAATDREVSTRRIFDSALAQCKLVSFPRVVQERLEFIEVRRWEELTPGYKNILEPTHGRSTVLGALDLLVVPGLAFDRFGHRIGWGAGFYDRLLAGRGDRPKVAGLAYDFQFLSHIPNDERDRNIDFVVTERGARRT